jgi:hypothetical protein
MHLKNRPRVGFFMSEFYYIQDLYGIVFAVRLSHLVNLWLIREAGTNNSTPCLKAEHFENVMHNSFYVLIKNRPRVGFFMSKFYYAYAMHIAQ